MRQGFHITGESVQGCLSKILAKMDRESPDRFHAFLAMMARCDNTVRVQALKSGYSLIVGEHAYKRLNQRSILCRALFDERVAEIANNPIIQGEMSNHLVFFDGDNVAPVEADGVDATAVVDMKSRLLYVFEMGWDYIVLKTVMDLATSGRNVDGSIRVYKNNAVIKLYADGFIEFDEGKISEARRETEEEYINRKAKEMRQSTNQAVLL